MANAPLVFSKGAPKGTLGKAPGGAAPLVARTSASKDALGKAPSGVPPLVAILMGSKSDWEVVKAARDQLAALGVPCEAKVLSAHRAPGPLHAYVTGADQAGTRVFICAAGGAAHLAGVVASLTTRPVIAIPIAGKVMDGLDSLLAMVQMPKGVPVATVAVNGAANAGLLAAQMLALSDDALARRLADLRRSEEAKILAEKLE